MRLELDEQSLNWQRKARRFADEELIQWEVHAEMNGGEIPAEARRRQREMALELGFSAMDVPAGHGGHALPSTTQVAVWEQLGRVTNALSWCFSEPQRWMFEACSAQQLDHYILPMMHGARHECYAITEAGPGSDVEAIEATATPCDGGYLLSGEKWYVTGANLADFFIFQAVLPEGEHALFFVEMGSEGVRMLRSPQFSHTFESHHPVYAFDRVFVPAGNRIGRPGDGMAYTHSWFRRERLMIAARSCGAAARLIEEATAFAEGRSVGGEALADKQAIQFMLADSATELWCARLLTYEAARAHDRGDDLKALHSSCSMAKLFASEMVNRVADRAVQIFGGRGYMRENVAERFFREVRVDRIWEGTSEIQRLIISRALRKRGLDGM